MIGKWEKREERRERERNKKRKLWRGGKRKERQ